MHACQQACYPTPTFHSRMKRGTKAQATLVNKRMSERETNNRKRVREREA